MWGRLTLGVLSDSIDWAYYIINRGSDDCLRANSEHWRVRIVPVEQRLEYTD